ncbi:MAG: DUF4340 domain-containing protein [Bacteroidetes bacterium]|nr:DUF4340 domain-containing protein [Bacteroidota bacterium]
MKRIWITLVILVITVLAALLLWKNVNRTSALSPRAFALDNPSAVNRIFFSSNNAKAGYLIFEKKAGRWTVTDGKSTFNADTASIHDLLFWVMAKNEVYSPVPDASKDLVTKDISISGVKAIFYNGKSELKTIYAGGPTPNQEMTYMYLPGTERPSIIHIPGHTGYLSPYFKTSIDQWRSLAMLDAGPEDIEKVLVLWPQNAEDGFEIRREEGSVKMYTLEGTAVNARQTLLEAYMEVFRNVNHEAGDQAGVNRNSKARDSLLASTPFFRVKLFLKGKQPPVELNIYRMQKDDPSLSAMKGAESLQVYETEQFWANLTGSREIWVMQDVVLKNRMKRLKDFIR